MADDQNNESQTGDKPADGTGSTGNKPLRFGSRPTDNNDTASDGNEQTNEQQSNAAGGPNTAESNHVRIEESEKQELKPVTGAKSPFSRYTDANPTRSANELGITTTAGEDSKSESAHLAAAEQGGSDSGETLYTCHPLQNFAIGPFQFTNSIMRLSGEDVGKFEEVLEKLPPYEASKIAKIDKSRVDDIVKARQQATQLNDSSLERRALESVGINGGKQFGTEEVGADQRRDDQMKPEDSPAFRAAQERDYNQG